MMLQRLLLTTADPITKTCCRSVAIASRRTTTSSSRSSYSKKNEHHGDIPFYGAPRPAAAVNESTTSSLQSRCIVALHSAATALMDPTRADAVAALGEVTGRLSLERLQRELKKDNNNTVRRIFIEDRPIVSQDTISSLLQSSKNKKSDKGSNNDKDPLTFGEAYVQFLQTHDFDPDGRDPIQYIPTTNSIATTDTGTGITDENSEMDPAYIMLRYRQCHDFWHTLTGLPPTVVGELGLKWLELFQTGLPIAALSATAGSLTLSSSSSTSSEDRDLLFQHYVPWAHEQSQQLTTPLLAVYYEEEFDTPLDELRKRLNLTPAPTHGIHNGTHDMTR